MRARMMTGCRCLPSAAGTRRFKRYFKRVHPAVYRHTPASWGASYPTTPSVITLPHILLTSTPQHPRGLCTPTPQGSGLPIHSTRRSCFTPPALVCRFLQWASPFTLVAPI
uniref:Uncharacterized protein n=1 Tax=Cacopsylla melanoneura TaxID=428564 RepID=A0A8D8M366_9HEMI